MRGTTTWEVVELEPNNGIRNGFVRLKISVDQQRRDIVETGGWFGKIRWRFCEIRRWREWERDQTVRHASVGTFGSIRRIELQVNARVHHSLFLGPNAQRAESTIELQMTWRKERPDDEGKPGTRGANHSLQSFDWISEAASRRS